MHNAHVQWNMQNGSCGCFVYLHVHSHSNHCVHTVHCVMRYSLGPNPITPFPLAIMQEPLFTWPVALVHLDLLMHGVQADQLQE